MIDLSAVDALQLSEIFLRPAEAVRFAGALGGVVSATLFTVTLTVDDDPLFPAASYAVELNMCVLFVADVVFHDHAYGDDVSVETSAPSR